MTTATHPLVISQDESTPTWAFPIGHRTKEKPTFALTALYAVLIASGIPWQYYWCTHGWAKRLQATWALSVYATFWIQFSAKNKPVWQEFWLAECGCFHLLQNSLKTIACCFLLALMLVSGPAGSEAYCNGVCSPSLAISAMYQSCKSGSECWGPFLLLPENTSSHPSLSLHPLPSKVHCKEPKSLLALPTCSAP